MKEALLIKYGEICLRGANRGLFERRLQDVIQRRLSAWHVRVFRENGRFLVESGEEAPDWERIMALTVKTLGVIGVSPCVKIDDQSLPNLCETALAYLRLHAPEEAFTFKIETKRADKRYPVPSLEVSAEIGGFILEHMPRAKVDVHSPQVRLRVELRNHAYVYAKTIQGVGGLPYGSSGRGVLLLSGGIDSPVAGFLTAKRGVDLTAVYFHSPPYTSERAKDKAADLAKALSSYTGAVKLYVVPFTDIQLRLHENVRLEKLTILLKRAMLRTAERIAFQENCQCLITGDSVGQVASQTLHSLLAVQSAVRLPILRPLAGMDKQEIIDWAKKIETYDISIRPYEDCCTIFVAEHPETKPNASAIEREERRAGDLEALIREAVRQAEIVKIGEGSHEHYRWN
ncbi:MAG: tRNA 4-thiouridine(8) synthase ThiI [Clostridiales bacterium]|nr:tRNA 4-thiouridine(8) synthase ThiI [Clostridiales bacterium]